MGQKTCVLLPGIILSFIISFSNSLTSSMLEYHRPTSEARKQPYTFVSSANGAQGCKRDVKKMMNKIIKVFYHNHNLPRTEKRRMKPVLSKLLQKSGNQNKELFVMSASKFKLVPGLVAFQRNLQFVIKVIIRSNFLFLNLLQRKDLIESEHKENYD